MLATVLFNDIIFGPFLRTYFRVLDFAHVEWGVTRGGCSLDLVEVLRFLVFQLAEVASVDKAC
jgi:hypothetical protein